MPWSTGDELRVARKRKGLKGEELAEIIGVTAKTIYRWEDPKNPTEPSITQWRAIAKACDAPWLLGGGDTLLTYADGIGIVAEDQQPFPNFEYPPARKTADLTLVGAVGARDGDH
jgi:transcriptional regulator with XRE-family HTH domain